MTWVVTTDAPLRQRCVLSATQTLRDLARLVDDSDGTLQGVGAALLLLHEIGDTGLVPRRVIRRWIDRVKVAASADRLDLFAGALGAHWLLEELGIGTPGSMVEERARDAVQRTWQGGLAPFDGGLTAILAYAAALKVPRDVLIRHCVDRLLELAIHSGSDCQWLPPGLSQLPGLHLLNLEGSSAALAAMGMAGTVLRRSDRAVVRSSLATLARKMFATNRSIGEAGTVGRPGIVHGSGTWALGTAGAVLALVSASRWLGDRTSRSTATTAALALADASPETCNVYDTSIGTGTAGIACTLQHAYWYVPNATLAAAARWWILRTLGTRIRGAGYGGYLHFGRLATAADDRASWRTRPGLLEGAAGTALALLRYARGGSRTNWPLLFLMA